MWNNQRITTPEPAIDIYQYANSEVNIHVTLDTDTVWLRQAQIALLFDTSADNICLHLREIFSEPELNESTTIEDFSVVRQEDNRPVRCLLKHYNLDAIRSVGYRVSSKHVTQFRQ